MAEITQVRWGDLVEILKADFATLDLLAAQGNLPAGGNVNQIIKKDSSTDYDTSWAYGALADDAPIWIRENTGVFQYSTNGTDWNNIVPTASDLGNLIYTLTSKTTPVDTDSLVLSDSAASNTAKKLTWSNLKNTLLTYFNTIFTPLTRTISTTAPLTGGGALSSNLTLDISNATTSTDGAMSSTDKTKLDGIESGATADQTANEILTLIKTVDGASSGLDADLFYGRSILDFLTVDDVITHNAKRMVVTGATITSNEFSVISWSVEPLYVIGMGKDGGRSTAGYWKIEMPTSGATIPAYGDLSGTDILVSGTGIPLNQFSCLYAEITGPGATETALRIVGPYDTFTVPNDWIPLVVNQPYTATLTWFVNGGITIPADLAGSYNLVDGHPFLVAEDDRVGDFIVSLNTNSTPVDTDLFTNVDVSDSNRFKKMTWANIKSTLKTYFDTVYQATGNYLTTATSFGGDVSGTYNNLQVTDDSHIHDGRYYTESESEARYLRSNAADLVERGGTSGQAFNYWNYNTGARQSNILWDLTKTLEHQYSASSGGNETFAINNTDYTTADNGGLFAGGKVIQTSGYRTIFSDFIPVVPGETIYGEISYRLISGSGGTLFLGVERYDKNKNPVTINAGTIYFVAANHPATSTSWEKLTGSLVIPTNHTPYEGSDGGGVHFVRVRLLMNYSSGGALRQFGGVTIYRWGYNGSEFKIGAYNAWHEGNLTNLIDAINLEGGVAGFVPRSYVYERTTDQAITAWVSTPMAANAQLAWNFFYNDVSYSGGVYTVINNGMYVCYGSIETDGSSGVDLYSLVSSLGSTGISKAGLNTYGEMGETFSVGPVSLSNGDTFSINAMAYANSTIKGSAGRCYVGVSRIG